MSDPRLKAEERPRLLKLHRVDRLVSPERNDTQLECHYDVVDEKSGLILHTMAYKVGMN